MVSVTGMLGMNMICGGKEEMLTGLRGSRGSRRDIERVGIGIIKEILNRPL